MKLLIVSLLCIHAVCGRDLLQRNKRAQEDFLVGGAEYPTGMYANHMAYIENGLTSCSGVCIGKKVVLTCGACVATDSPANIKLQVGPSKTDDGGGVKVVRTIKNTGIGILITNEEMTTCEPIKLPCRKKQVPAVGESSTIVSWGMTSLTTTPDKLQILEAAWGGSSTCCGQSFPDVITDDVKKICMLHGQSTQGQGTCFGDCGAPVIKEGRLAGILIRNSPDCATGKCSVVVSVYPYLSYILGPMGAGANLQDQFTSDTPQETATVTLPYTVPKSDCVIANPTFTPDSSAPGTACADPAKTTKVYKDSPEGTLCQKKKIQKAGIVLVNNKVKCSTSTLKEATGCECCEKGIVKHFCYMCEPPTM